MERISITIDADLLGTIDALMQRRGYTSRSEAVRDLVRAAAAAEAAAAGAAPCLGVLSYVYDHETRSLARGLMRSFHDHHDLAVASLHVHLDHASCLEVAVLRGPAGAVRGLADAVATQRGVRHDNLFLLPVREEDAGHDHGAGATAHRHVHA